MLLIVSQNHCLNVEVTFEQYMEEPILPVPNKLESTCTSLYGSKLKKGGDSFDRKDFELIFEIL